MALGSWVNNLLGTQQTQTTASSITTTLQGLGLFSNSTAAWQTGLAQSSSYVPYISLSQAEIKQVMRLLAIKDMTDDERTELAQSLSEHTGIDLAMVTNLLVLVKTMLELGELQAKLAEKDEPAQLGIPASPTIQWTGLGSTSTGATW